MASGSIKVRKLPDTPWRRLAVLVLVILVHGAGIFVWMRYGGLNTTPALPPMMVIMDPEPKPAPPNNPADTFETVVIGERTLHAPAQISLTH